MTMRTAEMGADAKRQLSSTIRGLRERLLDDLHAATERTYRLSVRIQDAGLDEEARTKRQRLQSWIDEQVRAEVESVVDREKKPKWSSDKIKSHHDTVEVRLREKEGIEARFRRDAEKQAAYTLLNRLIILRLMEAAPESGPPLRAPAVVTGGWDSPGYAAFRELGRGLVKDDATEGYAFLLQLVFDDLATDLPGLFGPAGIAELIPVRSETLRHVVEALDDEGLKDCWTDDMTLGWVYQYWNDPEREALDAKLNAGGKVEPHEIASKTQMFTERYMVDWLLQNSLGPMWLAMCKKHGWTPECASQGVLDALEERRKEWRGKRERGEVELTELMPLHSDDEKRWADYLPQPIPEDAVEHAPETLRDLKILDPAVGSGHFLVVAFDLLFALYEEEARHRRVADGHLWQPRAIVERILEHNLHGIDLDPRAVQIAAAALWLKAQQRCREAEPAQLNLVASNLRLASLADCDPALVELRREVQRETGIPASLTDSIVEALKGADHLGSLLKVDQAVLDAIAKHEAGVGTGGGGTQRDMFMAAPAEQQQLLIDGDAARATVLEQLERFLDARTHADELGLRLRGEQLATGVRFLRSAREGSYDVVVGNPPYQGTPKLSDSALLAKAYPLGKADLYSAFLERALELVRRGGTSALLTMRNWMFIRQFRSLREHLLSTHDLRALGDFAVGAFDEVPNDVLSVVVSVFRRAGPSDEDSLALQPTPVSDRSYDRQRTERKRAATRVQFGRFSFKTEQLRDVPEWPLVFWWDQPFLDQYVNTPKIDEVGVVKCGMGTSDNARFLRKQWEIRPLPEDVLRRVVDWPAAGDVPLDKVRWAPFIKGGEGRSWIEPLTEVLNWRANGLEAKLKNEGAAGGRIVGEEFFFSPGVAFSLIGNEFLSRTHRYFSICGNKGSSVFGVEGPSVLCAMSRTLSKTVMESLNPGIGFEVGDVRRLPLYVVPDAEEVFRRVDAAFSVHESHREASVEFTRPGPSPWGSAQRWAQAAVDRVAGEPLRGESYSADEEPAAAHVSYALGIALGRFDRDGGGVVVATQPADALAGGICFLNGALVGDDGDSLGQRAADALVAAWRNHGAAIAPDRTLREWLRLDFFASFHKGMYEGRPIYWPLSSGKKTFVAWVNIHCWEERTLRVLLADHLGPALDQLDGELPALREAREGANKGAAREAERRFAKVQAWREELKSFIDVVEKCAEAGPPPTDGKCPPRDVDARYLPTLDDGVMINSAALWPLLDPQWIDPKKWWKQLATANPKGNKDYDWSHLAMRYWPKRVDGKCRKDPSLGVAHGCFWRYHPERAWAWELRLQDEIGSEFRIEEKPYGAPGEEPDDGDKAHRDAYLRSHVKEALAAVEKEVLRRKKKHGEVQADLRMLDPGLWSTDPAACWELEMRLSEKQKVEFHLVAPDDDARDAYAREHPEKADARRQMLAKLAPAELSLGAVPRG